MTYNRPQLVEVGDAVTAIQATGKPNSGEADTSAPAYDLDE